MRSLLLFSIFLFSLNLFGQEKSCDGMFVEQKEYNTVKFGFSNPILSPDKNFLSYYSYPPNEIKIINLKSGEVVTAPHRFQSIEDNVSKSVSKLIAADEKSTDILDLITKKTWHFDGKYSLSPDEKMAVSIGKRVDIKNLGGDQASKSFNFKDEKPEKVQFTNDAKKLITTTSIPNSVFNFSKSALHFTDLQSGKDVSEKFKEKILKVSTSSDGNFATVTFDKNEPPKLISFMGTKKKIIDIPSYPEAQIVDVIDGNPLIKDKNNKYALLDAKSGSEIMSAPSNSKKEFYDKNYGQLFFDEAGKTAAVDFKRKEKKIFDGEMIVNIGESPISSGKMILTQTGGANWLYIRQNELKIRAIVRDDIFSEKPTISDDKKNILVLKNGKYGDQPTLDVKSLDPNGSDLHFTLPCATPYTRSFHTQGDKVRFVCVNPDQLGELTLNGGKINYLNLSSLSMTQWDRDLNDDTFLHVEIGGFKILKRQCGTPIIQNVSTCSDCGTEAPSASDLQLTNLKIQTLCGLPINQETIPLWDKALPEPVDGKLDETTARNWLFRFQKSGGFEPTKHASILEAILTSKKFKSEPDLLAGALQVVMGTSPLFYDQLMRKYPDLPSPVTNSMVCRTKDDEGLFEKNVNKYLNYLVKTIEAGYGFKSFENTNDPKELYQNIGKLIDFFTRKNSGKITIDNYSPAIPLLKLLKNVPPEFQAKKDEITDKIAQSLADRAADSPEYHDVFLSKLYKFTSQVVNEMVGDPVKPLTDMSVLRGAVSIEPIVLGVRPLDGDVKTKSPFGFYAKRLPAIPLEDGAINFKKEYTWKMDNKKYHVNLSVDEKDLKQLIIPQDDAPKYDELWKDNTLHGIIITGSNLKDMGKDVMGSYLSYYQSQGFTFPETPTKIDDLEKFLGDNISSGKADYFIKEAHSDGDEKNIFRIDHEANYLRGVKTLPGGKKEVVDLVFPLDEESTTKLISNEKFGKWVRTRDGLSDPKLKGNQFVFFNTSCWSKTKALHEIEAAGTKTLLDIPSLTTVLTFTNEPSSAEYQLFDSFRNGKNYQEIKKNMEKNEGFKKRVENHFIFPTDHEYYAEIGSKLAHPLDIKYQVKDEAGKNVNIDEIH